jgi:hypothetical protein
MTSKIEYTYWRADALHVGTWSQSVANRPFSSSLLSSMEWWVNEGRSTMMLCGDGARRYGIWSMYFLYLTLELDGTFRLLQLATYD